MNMIPKNKGEMYAEEKWSGKTIKSLTLHNFGDRALTFIPEQKRGKLDSRSGECIFMGYAPNGFRLYSKDRSSIIIARDVVFP